jgi:hypothetical protein
VSVTLATSTSTVWSFALSADGRATGTSNAAACTPSEAMTNDGRRSTEIIRATR